MYSAGPEPAPRRGRHPLLSPSTAAYWIAPGLLCLLVYWFGLQAWFQMDDFAWVALHMRVHDFGSFLDAMFKPMAQGTIRPWSERLFFFANWHLFGLEAAPMRAVVFLTQVANLVLLCVVVRRLTGSAVAGFAAPVLWLVNGNLYVPMAWTAAYNQILCAFFLLAAVLLWIRYTDSGDRRWWWAQFAVFVLAFGALEINVVFPVLAALYALGFARKYLWHTLPMFAVSGAYAILHRMIAPEQKTEIYRMYFDLAILQTLATYLQWSMGADRYAKFRRAELWPFYAAEAVVGVAIAVFLVWAVRRRQWLALFCTGWFLVTLGPVLPLKNHVSDYYLTIPTIGLAMLGGWAVGVAWERGTAMWAIAVVVALLYALPSAWMAHGMTHEYYRISQRVRTFVGSVAYAHQLHADKALLIRNMDSELFWACWWDNPFQLFGRRRIFVAAEAEDRIAPFVEMGTLSRFFLPETLAVEGMREGQVVAYDLIGGDRLRNTTELYLARAERMPVSLPRFLDIRDPLSEQHLGEGWWEAEPTHRWMSKRATLQVRGPETAGAELVLRGRAPEQLVESGPVHLKVTVDGMAYPASRIASANIEFEFRYPLAPETAGDNILDVVMEVDRTLRTPGDEREIGVAFGTVEVMSPTQKSSFAPKVN